MQGETINDVREQIDQTRKDIAALQARIRAMAIRREANRPKPSDQTHNRRIAYIVEQLDEARELARKNPAKAKSLQSRIDALEIEKYRLMLTEQND